MMVLKARDDRLTMAVERRALLVVAGLPGGGKSTMLRRVSGSEPVTVLDSDQVRVRLAAVLPPGTPYPRYRPLVHVLHRLRTVAAAATAPGPVVVHVPATAAVTRLSMVLTGALTGRARHLLWVDCTPEQALAGQYARGRPISSASFDRHVARAARVRARLSQARPPRGWRSASLVDRSAAGLHLRFPPQRHPLGAGRGPTAAARSASVRAGRANLVLDLRRRRVRILRPASTEG